MQKLSNLVEIILRKVYKRHGVVFSEIMVNWSKIIGAKYYLIARPVRITQMRESNTTANMLHVEVDSASCSMELAYQQNIILERIAVYFGYQAINKIRFTVRPKLPQTT